MTKFPLGKAAILTCAALILGATATACSGSDPSSESLPTGSVGMEIILPGGQEILSVRYKITGGPENVNIGGDIDVADLAATVSAVIGGLPEGGPYKVELSATSTDGKVTCLGSKTFDVVAGQTTAVSVELSCRTADDTGSVDINGEFNQCPVIKDFRVAPLKTTPNTPVDVSAGASDADGDVLTFAWSTTGGSFVDAAAAATKYNCSPGVQKVSVTVSDGDPECDTTKDVDVNCVVLTCGNGQADAGEGCDDGNNVNGDGCNAFCVAETCGDGVVNNRGSEQCDDGNTASNDGCSSTCQREMCGDNIINGAEKCDGTALPPGVPAGIACRADCTLPPYCGDGIKNGSEQCDDGNSVDTDACKNDCTKPVVLTPCQACAQANCSAFVSDCFDNATDPGDLCQGVTDCVDTTKCAATTSENCYCGSLSIGLCVALDGIGFDGRPAGACKAPIDASAGFDGTEVAGDKGTKVSERFVDPRYPLGRAFRLVNCERNSCKTECGLN